VPIYVRKKGRKRFEENCAKSEKFQYFLSYLKCLRLIRSRSADFLSHIKAVKELLPLFFGDDGVLTRDVDHFTSSF
jgi:hypothetical protein